MTGPGLRWTQDDYDAHMAQFRVVEKEPDVQPDNEKESVLAGKIMKWCKDRGYPCQCFRQSIKARGFLVPGWPD